MKHLLLFFLSILIGIIVVVGYRTWFINTNITLSKTFNKSVISTIKFSLENAPSQSLQGRIASLSGNVQWQSRTAAQSVPLTMPRFMQQGEAVSTGDDGKILIKFPGFVTVNLLQDAVLNFIQTLPANLVFEQNSGIVSYTKEGAAPVSIRTFGLLTTMKQGIVIMVVKSTKENTAITVQKGSVIEGFNDTQNISNVVTINEGNQFVFNNDTKKGVIQ